MIDNFFLKNKITIIDVGCAGGIDPIFLNLIEKNYASAIGFDGDAEEIKKLNSLNKRKNIKYFNNLISDTNKVLNFNLSGSVSSINVRKDRKKIYKEKYKSAKVQSYTLDEWVSANILKNNIILKLDIEGSEVKALKGAKNLLKQCVSTVKVEFNYHSEKNTNNFYEIHKLLLDNNFQLMSLSNEENHMFGTNSGDALYFKTINGFDKLINEEFKKNNIIQMILISIFLKKFEYASLLLSEYENIIPISITNKFWDIIIKNQYISNLNPFSFPKISFLFYYLSVFFAGKKSHSKSFSKINRLTYSKYLFFNSYFSIFKKKYKKQLIDKIKKYKIINNIK